MTLNEMISVVRSKTRVHQIDKSDTDIARYLNHAILEFSHNVGGITTERYYPLVAYFDCSTQHAISVETDIHTKTDVPLVSENLDHVTGDVFAAELQAQLRSVLSDATITVTWSEGTRNLTFTFPGVAGIDINSPSTDYADGTGFVGGKWQITGTTYTTANWLGYWLDAQLASNSVTVFRITWNNRNLYDAPFAHLKRENGSPLYYGVRDNILRVSPIPQYNIPLYVFGREEFSLFTIAETLDTTQTINVPDEHEIALVYHAAGSIAEDRFEYDIANRMFAQYQRLLGGAIANIANQTPSIGFSQKRTVSTGLRNEEVNL